MNKTKKTIAEETGTADDYSIMNNRITINSIYADMLMERFVIKYNVAKDKSKCEGNINYKFSPLIEKLISISFDKATELKIFDNLIKLLKKYE